MNMRTTDKVRSHWTTSDGRLHWVVDIGTAFKLSETGKSNAHIHIFNSLSDARAVTAKNRWVQIEYEFVKEPAFEIETPERRIRI